MNAPAMITPFTLVEDPQPAKPCWHPADLPYASALLSATMLDLRTLLEKQVALATQLDALTRQHAAVGTEVRILRQIEDSIRAVLPQQEGGAE